jgi:hypothetical protein
MDIQLRDKMERIDAVDVGARVNSPAKSCKLLAPNRANFARIVRSNRVN